MFQKILWLITRKKQGYMVDFSIDCNAINISDTISIHIYSIKKHNIKPCFD